MEAKNPKERNKGVENEEIVNTEFFFDYYYLLKQNFLILPSVEVSETPLDLQFNPDPHKYKVFYQHAKPHNYEVFYQHTKTNYLRQMHEFRQILAEKTID